MAPKSLPGLGRACLARERPEDLWQSLGRPVGSRAGFLAHGGPWWPPVVYSRDPHAVAVGGHPPAVCSELLSWSLVVKERKPDSLRPLTPPRTSVRSLRGHRAGGTVSCRCLCGDLGLQMLSWAPGRRLKLAWWGLLPGRPELRLMRSNFILSFKKKKDFIYWFI